MDMFMEEFEDKVRVRLRRYNERDFVDMGRYDLFDLSSLVDEFRKIPIEYRSGDEAVICKFMTTQWAVDNGQLFFEIIIE